jgi:hypothetical protein
LFIMGSEESSLGADYPAYSRAYRPRWLHIDSGNLQGVAFFSRRSVNDLHGVAHAQDTCAVVDQVLPEKDLGSDLAEAGEGTQGFPALISGLLIHGRYDAESDGAYAYLAPAVLREGLAAPDNQVGAEAIHGNGPFEAVIQVGEVHQGAASSKTGSFQGGQRRSGVAGGVARSPGGGDLVGASSVEFISVYAGADTAFDQVEAKVVTVAQTPEDSSRPGLG